MIRTRTQRAIDTPFDNSSNGFPSNATNVQKAIESAFTFDPIFAPHPLFDDFDGRMAWSPSTSGTGASASVSDGNTTQASGKHVGVARVATGTALNSGGALVWSGNLSVSIVLGDGMADYRALIKLPILSSNPGGNTDYTARIGLGTSGAAAGDHTDGVYFEHVASNANWILKTASNSARTSLTSSIAVVANTWTELRWICNAAGTSVEFFVNNVSAGTITTNIPTVTARGCGGNFYTRANAALSAIREMFIDYFYFSKSYTARD